MTTRATTLATSNSPMDGAAHRRLRFGILGSARIAPTALIDPATRAHVDVLAVAARDRERARAFATANGVPSVSRSYAELLERHDLDAVYLPLPPALRLEWTLRALERGLHVLAEKPIAMNGVDARQMVDAAEARGLILAEGFHYVFHPMFGRAMELLGQGLLGEIEDVEALFN